MSIKKILVILMIVLTSVYFISTAVLFYSIKKYMDAMKEIDNLERERNIIVENVIKYREGNREFSERGIFTNFGHKFISKLRSTNGENMFSDFMEYTIAYHSQIKDIVLSQNRLVYNSISIIVLLQIIFVIGSSYGIFILYNRILQPVRGLKRTLKEMEEKGRTNIRINYDINDEMGEFIYLFNSIMDKMTDLLKEKEDQIRENNRIQREINSLNEELQTTMEELQSSTEELLEKNEELKRLERELESANEKLKEKLKEEEEIASKREKFIESILSSMDSSVIITDKNGKIEMVNRKCYSELGINNMSDSNIKDIVKISDVSWDYILSNIKEKGEWAIESSIKVGDNDIPINIKGKMIYNDVGDEMNIIFILENLYGKKYFDDKIKEMQKLQSIGLIVSGLVHDFNNLLGVIRGGFDMIKGKVPVQYEKNMDRIESAISRAIDLSRNLLTLAKSESGVKEVCDVNSIIKDVVKIYDETSGPGIKFDLQLSSDVKPMLFDKAKISEMIMNLIVNGIEAIEGNGKITVKTYCSKEVKTNKQYLCIEVKDTGKGIDDSIKDKIFEPFFSTKKDGKSVGLGLSVVYTVVMEHRGSIDFTTSKEGTTFIIKFPMHDDIQENRLEDKRKIGYVKKEGKGELVLVIEDEKGLLGVIVDMLDMNGYEVYGVESGREAIEFMERYGEDVSVIVLDIKLGDMNGKEVLKHIRDMGYDTPVVVSTGFAEQDIVSELYKLGINGFLNKPYKIEELLKVLKGILVAGDGENSST